MPIPGATLKSCTGQEEGSPEKYVTASAAVSGCRPPGERTRRADPASGPGTRAMFPPHVRAPAALSSAPSVSSSPSPPKGRSSLPDRRGAPGGVREPENRARGGSVSRRRKRRYSCAIPPPGTPGARTEYAARASCGRFSAPTDSPQRHANPVADSPRRPILRKDTRTSRGRKILRPSGKASSRMMARRVRRLFGR